MEMLIALHISNNTVLYNHKNIVPSLCRLALITNVIFDNVCLALQVYSAISVFSVNLTFVMHCVIWYHLYNLKKAKNTHRGMLI